MVNKEEVSPSLFDAVVKGSDSACKEVNEFIIKEAQAITERKNSLELHLHEANEK